MRLLGRLGRAGRVVLSAIGFVLLLFWIFGMSDLVLYKDQPLGVALLKEVRSWVGNNTSDPASSSSETPSSMRTYTSDRWRITFAYVSPEFAVTDDRAVAHQMAITEGHDFAVVAVTGNPTAERAEFSSIFVLADDVKDLLADSGLAPIDMAEAAGGMQVDKATSEGGLEKTRSGPTRLGGLPGYRCVLTGTTDGVHLLYDMRWAATRRTLYAVIFICPIDDDTSQRESERDAMLATLRLGT